MSQLDILSKLSLKGGASFPNVLSKGSGSYSFLLVNNNGEVRITDFYRPIRFTQDTQPTSAEVGDRWLRTSDMKEFVYLEVISNPSTTYWIETTSPKIN